MNKAITRKKSYEKNNQSLRSCETLPSGYPSKLHLPATPSGLILLDGVRRSSFTNVKEAAIRNQPQIPNVRTCKFEVPVVLKKLLVKERPEVIVAKRYVSRTSRDWNELYGNSVATLALFTELFADLEEAMPECRQLFSITKSLAGALRPEGRKCGVSTFVPRKPAAPRVSLTLSHSPSLRSPQCEPTANVNGSGDTLISGFNLLKRSIKKQPKEYSPLRLLPETGTPCVRKTSDASTATRSSCTPKVVPRLDLQKLSHVADYNEEFIEKAEEFSGSWRIALKNMKMHEENQ